MAEESQLRMMTCHIHGAIIAACTGSAWECPLCISTPLPVMKPLEREAVPSHFVEEIFQKFREHNPNSTIKNLEYQRLEDGTITLFIKAKEN